MKKRILATILTVLTVLTTSAFPIIGSAKETYEYLGIPGFESYNRMSLALVYRYGIRNVAPSTDKLPFFEKESSIKLTTIASEEGANRIEFATCRAYISDEITEFAAAPKADPSAGGKSYNAFGRISPADSDGMSVYVAAKGSDSVYIPKGTVRMQFSVSPSKGDGSFEQYADYPEGFVFESKEFPISPDGYAYVEYDGARPIDGATPADADFIYGYLSKVNAVNIIITPEEKINDGDIFYIADLGVYRDSADYQIRTNPRAVYAKKGHIVISSAKEGSMSLLLNGKKLPEYIVQTERIDSFGNYCIDIDLNSDYIGEGYHTLAFLLDGKKVCEKTLCFDCTPPLLSFSSIRDGKIHSSSGEIKLEGIDGESGLASITATLDNKAITLPYRYSSLSNGNHVVKYTLTDAAGNTENGNITFTVGGVSFGELTVSGSGVLELEISGLDGKQATLYSLENGLPVSPYVNVADLSELSERTPDGETAAPIGGGKITSRDERYPYLAYEVDVSGYTEEEVVISFTGAANIGESLILSAYSEKNSAWVELDRAKMTGGSLVLSAVVNVADYAAEGKIKCRVALLSVDNGADSFAWTTDGQHAIEHNYEDGSYRDYTFYLEEQNEWLVEEYNNGNIAYVVNTGDIANESDNESQYAEAREINNILENANIPNGVLPGNHDIFWGNTDDMWIYWERYFGAKYYESGDWFGGAYDEANRAHYDLVTVGGRDMIFMCASFGLDKNNQELYDWISETLNTYSDRTAVFCTHSYIGVEGELTTDGGIEWWKNVVSKCPTISLVLCGHEPGSATNIRMTEDGRQVTEILHDYQSDWYPNWWNWGEGGWGLFRYVTFGDGTVTNRTYTASKEHYDKDYYWDYDLENFTIPMTFIENNRVIEGYNFVAMPSIKGTEIASGTVKDGKAFFEVTNTGGLYYVLCANNTSGIISVTKDDNFPILTSAKAYNGRLHLSWKFDVQQAQKYEVYVNGLLNDVLSADVTSYVSDAKYISGEKLTVAVAVVSESGEKIWSQISQVEVVGLGEFTYGDIDKSGVTDIADALAALRMSIGIYESVTPEEWFAADVDTDGETTVSDALKILRTAVGLKD